MVHHTLRQWVAVRRVLGKSIANITWNFDFEPPLLSSRHMTAMDDMRHVRVFYPAWERGKKQPIRQGKGTAAVAETNPRTQLHRSGEYC